MKYCRFKYKQLVERFVNIDVFLYSASSPSDPDVLDTWFSSGLFPFAMLGWPEQVSYFLQQSIAVHKQPDPFVIVITHSPPPTDRRPSALLPQLHPGDGQ